MRKAVLCSAILGAVLCGCTPQEHLFGAGFVLGDPNGLSMKAWLTPATSVNCALGWPEDGFDANIDYVFHNFDLLRVDRGRMAMYFGGGLKMQFLDNPARDDRFGIRMIVGLAYQFERARVETFMEVAPAIQVSPDTGFGVDAGLGARYFF